MASPGGRWILFWENWRIASPEGYGDHGARFMLYDTQEKKLFNVFDTRIGDDGDITIKGWIA